MMILHLRDFAEVVRAKMRVKRVASRTTQFADKNAHFHKMLGALNLLGRDQIDRMVGSLPVSHGLFAECYSKGGQLSPGCRGGKGWQSPFAFQTVVCHQLHIKQKKKKASVHL